MVLNLILTFPYLLFRTASMFLRMISRKKNLNLMDQTLLKIRTMILEMKVIVMCYLRQVQVFPRLEEEKLES